MALPTRPQHSAYDVVIIGGAMIGASVAFWLTRSPAFKGRVLVVERDPTYRFASTTASQSCIRQQFGSEINVRISQFGVDFIRNFADHVGDASAPEIMLHSFGYLYLADSAAFASVLRDNAAMQNRLGAGTRILTPDEIHAEYPFYNLDGIICGSLNTRDEGYFDSGTIFDWLRRVSRNRGAEYIHNEVTGIDRQGDRVTGVRLASGEVIGAGIVVNAAGPRAALTARMAGLEIPVEPRRRFTWIFDCATPLGRDLPLTIDPSGVHMRTDGRSFMTGAPPLPDETAADVDDFRMEDWLWEEVMWPLLATRVPAFERIRVRNSWVGHYAYNTLDQNAIVGAAPDLPNFLFCNGFSGHGLQQAPAMGRAIAELVIDGSYQTLDMTPLGYDRILGGTPLRERAII